MRTPYKCARLPAPRTARGLLADALALSASDAEFQVKSHCADLMRCTARILIEVHHIAALTEIFSSDRSLPLVPELANQVIPELLDKVRRDVDRDLSFHACALLFLLARRDEYLPALVVPAFFAACASILRSRSSELRLRVIVLQTLESLLGNPLTCALFRDFDLDLLLLQQFPDPCLQRARFAFLARFSEHPLPEETRGLLLSWASELDPGLAERIGQPIAALLLNLIRAPPFALEAFLASPLRDFVLKSVCRLPDLILLFFVEFQWRFPDRRGDLDIPLAHILALLSIPDPPVKPVFYTLANLHRYGLIDFADPQFSELPGEILRNIPDALISEKRLGMTVLAYMAGANPDLVFAKVAFGEVCQVIADMTPALGEDYVLDAVLDVLVAMKGWSTSRSVDDSHLALAAQAVADRVEELEPAPTDLLQRFFATFRLG